MFPAVPQHDISHSSPVSVTSTPRVRFCPSSFSEARAQAVPNRSAMIAVSIGVNGT
jgi:hypothetical protein